MGVAMASLALIFQGAFAQTHEGMIQGQGAEIGEKNSCYPVMLVAMFRPFQLPN